MQTTLPFQVDIFVYLNMYTGLIYQTKVKLIYIEKIFPSRENLSVREFNSLMA